MTKQLYELAGEIVESQAGSESMTSNEIVDSLRMVFKTLQEMSKSEAEGTILQESVKEGTLAAIDPQDSIQADKVICIECGVEMRQLTAKHLGGHGMTPKEYKKKYGFPLKTPLSAKSLTKARSKAAKKRGLPENLLKFQEARRQAKAQVSAATAPEPEEVIKPKNTRGRKKKA